MFSQVILGNEVTTAYIFIVRSKSLLHITYTCSLTHTQHSSVDQDLVNQYRFLDVSFYQCSLASNHRGSDRDLEYKLLYVAYGSCHGYRGEFSYDEVYLQYI